MELLLLLALIVLNGVFSMSELAVVSARKTRLQQQADRGNDGATVALKLAQQPNRFLSTVQIGITLIGIVAGAVGGAAIARQLIPLIQRIPALQPYAEEVSFGLVIALTTYLSLVIGELVPKRLALKNPEGIAILVARPMTLLSTLATPLVWLLSKSTEGVVHLLGVRGTKEPPITEGEILAMMREGYQFGVFAEDEPQMVRGVLRLDDIRIGGIVTPRTDIVWLDIRDDAATIKAKMLQSPYSTYPVVENDMDHIKGMVRLKDLLLQLMQGETIDLHSMIQKPLFVPESVPTSTVLQRFKQTGIHTAFIVGEHGGIEGVVTLHDIVEEIVGDLDGTAQAEDDREAAQREDGSWLLDGLLPLYRLQEIYPEFTIPEREIGDYETLAGFIMARLGHIPHPTEHFTWGKLTFEVMDMDDMRIDKVLVKYSDSDSSL